MSKKECKEAAPTQQPRRQSFWQRSKSIMSPNSNLDRSKSVFIELPHLKIVGSGSAAQLLSYEDKYEFALDYYGMLNHIFDENEAYYRSLKGADFPIERVSSEYEQAAQINEDGLLSPASTTTEKQGGFEYDGTVATFNDNPKFDSPLLSDDEVECFQDFSVSEEQISYDSAQCSSSSLSMETAIRSFVSGEYSLESAKSYSTDEVALMFGLMTVDDRGPKTLADGSVRCLVEGENGSIESIRFQNCWKTQQQQHQQQHQQQQQQQRPWQSEDNLNMTEIKTSAEEAPQKTSLKQRCQSLAHFSKASGNDFPSDLAASRRRSLGAKVSRIVAMYENVALQTPK